jgi:serine/threonine-protein kinase
VRRDDPRPPITPERWAAIDAVLQAALDLSPADRAAFVARECSGDADLLREVESLLAAGSTADDFLGRPTSDSDAEEPTLARLSATLAGRYALEREIGRGGMATVYLARDLRHKRPVALKVFHQALGTLVGPSRFHREIETAAGLSHPHILPLHDSAAICATTWASDCSTM